MDSRHKDYWWSPERGFIALLAGGSSTYFNSGSQYLSTDIETLSWFFLFTISIYLVFTIIAIASQEYLSRE